LNSPTQPKCGYQEILEQKYELAAQKIIRELFLYDGGATNDNLEEVLKTNPKNVGIKIF
jgi:dihydroorotase